MKPNNKKPKGKEINRSNKKKEEEQLARTRREK
jgi:hypothetical protein